MSLSERDRATLEDILAFGREAAELVSRGRSTYEGDLLLQRAAQMIALRHKVAHGYQLLDPQVIWQTIAHAIPEDISRIEDLLRQP